ncbi:LCP family protein [Intestinibacter bartlettii]|uniref:LCP family protein n=1 Tax=Intestinibacter bartlettii TaxID=261299 RepID=A0ABS6DZS5_9FIRM|nr:LCP family protein [Intestinibacter bartlettii]MBU5337350.1 LCP family protein [Intestinibacter bartlettii]
MKKLIFTMIYTIPVVLLVVALGNNFTSNSNTFLGPQTKQDSYTNKDSSSSKEAAITKESTKNQDNLSDNKVSQNKNNSTNKEKNKSNATSKIKIPKECDTITNILLVCTVPNDNSFENPPDKFSVLSLDSANNKISFIPIPLDTDVDIPGVGTKKLGDTYSWGDNTDLLLKAIESKFDAHITKVIEINTESLSEITDIFNDMGVEMTEDKLLEYLNETTVSKSMADDIKSIPIFKYPKLVKCMKPYIKTNMNTTSLIKYGIMTYRIVSHNNL